MKEKEILKNFREIRMSLENLNKMMGLIVRLFYDTGEEPEGDFEKSITDVQQKQYTKGELSYLG